MTNQDKLFLTTYLIAALLVAGVITENIRTALQPASVTVKTAVDIDKVKAKLTEAGVSWREGLYWEKLENK